MIYLFLVDGTQVLEPLAVEQLLRSGFSTQQEPVVNLPQHTPLIEGSNDICRISDSDGTRERIDGENSLLYHMGTVVSFEGKILVWYSIDSQRSTWTSCRKKNPHRF